MTRTEINTNNFDDGSKTLLELSQTQVNLLARGVELIREQQVQAIESSKPDSKVGDEVFILRELYKLQCMGVISSDRKVCKCK